MEKAALDALKVGLTRAKTRPQGFAFSPNGDDPILVLRAPTEKQVTRDNFKQEAEKELGIAFKEGSVFVGDLTVLNGALLFTVDPERSKGTLVAAKMQRSLLKLGKAVKIPKLGTADVAIGVAPLNDGRGAAADEDRQDVRVRIAARLNDLPAMLATANLFEGDEVPGGAVLRTMAVLRDELKLFLDSPAAKIPLLPGKKKEAIKLLVARVERDLARLVEAARKLKDSFGRAPRAAPEADPNTVEPLVIDEARLGDISKTLKAAAKAYAAAASSGDAEAHRKALLDLRSAGLAWQVRHPAASPADAAIVRDLIANADDRITELDVQSGVNDGYIQTTGGDDIPTGQSGSYFVGDKKSARKYVVKPIRQEALLAASFEQGDGARNEVSASKASSWLKRMGLQTGMPDAHLITLRSDKVSTTGQQLVHGRMTSMDVATAGDRVQPAVAVHAVAGARGSAATMEWRRHPTVPAIRVQEIKDDNLQEWARKNKEAAEPLFAQHYPDWDQLDEDAQSALLEQFLSKTGHVAEVQVPPDLSAPQLKRDVAVGLMMCVITGQLDHENMDNALISVENGRARIVPIDFGAATPTLKEASAAFDRNSGTSAKDPWGMWMQLPNAGQPMPADVLDQMAQLDSDGLAATLEAEEDRVSVASGGAVRSTDDSQRRVRKFMMDGMREAVRRARALQPPVELSPQQLHDVFVLDAGRTGPFAKAMKRLQALPIKQRTPDAWDAEWSMFLVELDDLLANGP